MKKDLSFLVSKFWREPMRALRTAHVPFLNFAALIHAFYAKPKSEPSGKIKISLLCPTRARPRQMAQMWHSAVETAQNPENIEVVFYLDNDDIVGMSGLRLAATKRAAQVRAVIGKRIILSECWNATAKIAHGEIFMHCGDDIIFRSPKWDAVVAENINSFPDQIAFVYGRDGIAKEDFGTHGFISRKWAEVTGYFVPPLFSSDYNDTWLNEVADKIGRKIFAPEIFTEHMHYMAGKSARDSTYRERLIRHKEDKVAQLWEETAHLREQDAQKLKAHINTFLSGKET